MHRLKRFKARPSSFTLKLGLESVVERGSFLIDHTKKRSISNHNNMMDRSSSLYWHTRLSGDDASMLLLVALAFLLALIVSTSILVNDGMIASYFVPAQSTSNGRNPSTNAANSNLRINSSRRRHASNGSLRRRRGQNQNGFIRQLNLRNIFRRQAHDTVSIQAATSDMMEMSPNQLDRIANVQSSTNFGQSSLVSPPSSSSSINEFASLDDLGIVSPSAVNSSYQLNHVEDSNSRMSLEYQESSDEIELSSESDSDHAESSIIVCDTPDAEAENEDFDTQNILIDSLLTNDEETVHQLRDLPLDEPMEDAVFDNEEPLNPVQSPYPFISHLSPSIHAISESLLSNDDFPQLNSPIFEISNANNYASFPSPSFSPTILNSHSHSSSPIPDYFMSQPILEPPTHSLPSSLIGSLESVSSQGIPQLQISTPSLLLRRQFDFVDESINTNLPSPQNQAPFAQRAKKSQSLREYIRNILTSIGAVILLGFLWLTRRRGWNLLPRLWKFNNRQ
jgi:hypothetical protein